MKRTRYENLTNAAGRYLIKRNCSDPDGFKRNKLKLKQTAEQFERSFVWGQNKNISVQSCSLTENDADVQYSKLKSWTESLDNGFKIEIEDILFPVFISLYRKLNASGNTVGARNFYSRHQSNFFKIPEYRKMAEKFCSESKSHFTMEVTQETFDALNYYVASTDHLVLQHLLNTSLEIVIMNIKLENEKDIPFVKPKTVPIHAISSQEETQDLLDIISGMNKLPPTTPLLKVYTIDTGQRKVCSASISSCYNYISCGFQDSSIGIWNVKNNETVQKKSISSNLDLACSIGLHHPLTTTSPEPPPSKESVSILHSHSGPVYFTQFTPKNDHLLSASDDTTLRLWDLETKEPIAVYRGHTYPVWTADIFQNEQFFVSGSQDRTAKLWAFERTYPLRIFAGHTADIDCVSIHPNGVYLATGSADSSIRMWSVTDGSTVRILVGHRGTILSVAFSPCGKYLASAGEDHRVKVWDVGGSSVIHDYSGHNDVIHGLSWLSESHLGSYSADGNIRIWNTLQAGSNTCSPNMASVTIPSQWKPVYLGRGFRQSLLCIGASD